MQEENDNLAQTIAGLRRQLERAGKAEVALRNELAKVREEEPDSEDVRELLCLWRDEVKGGEKRCKVDVSGPRGKHVKAMLRRYGKERLAHAVLGAPLDDWAMGRDRRTSGRTYNDIAKHILRDEETIERFEGLWLRARSAPVSAPALPRILDRLENVRQAGQGQWEARCPAHDDRHASLSVGMGRKGAVARCHAGCTVQDIAAALGVPLAEWFDAEPVAVPARAAEPLPSAQLLLSWWQRLSSHPVLLERLRALKGWDAGTLAKLGVGWDGERLVFPVHGPDGELVTVARYLPNGSPKMLGLRGRDRGLFPAPELIRGGEVWLVEGEPDAVSAHCAGLPGIGVPGVNGWRDEWSARFAGRRVVVCFDCDEPGRKAAGRVAGSLSTSCEVVVAELDPSRSDGFDLTDFILAGGNPGSVELNPPAPRRGTV